MRANPVDLIGGFYKDDSLPWSCQDTVNWLPVVAEVSGTRTVTKFSTPPGLKPWQQIGTGPIRGMHDCEGLRLIVSGRYLFRISNAGVGVPIGIIPGVGRVQMTHNQFKTGYQVLVENGQGGGGYVYNTVDDTFARITDEGYPGSISSDYLDSFLLGVEPQGRYWFHSNLADATDYNTLDRYEAEAAPDRIIGLAVSQFEVVVFGQRTTEFFFNAGGTTGTFQNRRQSITRGCASRHTIQKLDNTLFWLGDDGVVYRLNGYALQPVSTRALEKAIADTNFSEAIAYVWEDRGHKVYYLTIPNGQTFGYDVITGVWHRRESFGLSRWRLGHIQKWGLEWYGGDFQNGRIWQIDWDYFLEGDQPIISERTSGVVADNQSAMVIPNAELIFDTGHGPGTSPTLFPMQPTPPGISGHAPDGQVGQQYSPYQYVITPGSVAVRTVGIINGQLPNGASVSNAGLLTGPVFTDADSGVYKFTLRATDNNSLYSDLEDTLTVPYSVTPVGYALPQQTPATTFTITLPTFVAGDLIVVHVTTGAANTLPTPGTPVGWTSVASQTVTTASSARLGSRWIYRVMQTGDSTALVLSSAISSAFAVQAWNLRQRGTAPSLSANYGPRVSGSATRAVPQIVSPWGSASVIRVAAYVGLYSETAALPVSYPYPNGRLSTTSSLGVASFMPLAVSCHQTLMGSDFPAVNYTVGSTADTFQTNLLLKLG
jgi:hypothetical protein